jgi:hypothetical protein
MMRDDEGVVLYQRLTGDEPVVGLWKKDLPIHLSWRKRPLYVVRRCHG